MSAEATASGPVLAADHVSIRYGKAPVVDDVSFEVEPGSVFALLGRNGSGKSSLVRCLLGHQKPSRGSTRLFGRDAWRSRADAMRRVGILPEEPDAPPDMNTRDLVAFCRRLYPAWDDEGVEKRLARSRVPLGTPFGRLSKGQKNVVMLALCLGHRPELLVLDDPTLGLDAVAKKALYEELIGELAERRASVFLTTHDLAGVERLATRVGIVKDGRLLLDEDLENLKLRFRRIRCAAAAVAGGWAPFEPATSRRREWGAEAIVSNFDEDRVEEFRARTGASDLEVQSLALEEIFVAVAGETGAES
jgi:ABC-2 type transport system ATP-binding protein